VGVLRQPALHRYDNHGPSLMRPSRPPQRQHSQARLTAFPKNDHVAIADLHRLHIYRKCPAMFNNQLRISLLPSRPLFPRLHPCKSSVFGTSMIMEVIGGAASVSQLVVYISSSARTLHRLYTELRNGDSAYRNEETNIGLLLNILQRLERQDLEDHNPVLPVLIAISGLACQVLNLLQPRKVFGINWTPITAQDKLNSAFESLDKKRRLLHLYVSQTHHDALVDLRETIDRSNMTSQRPVVCLSRTLSRNIELTQTPDSDEQGRSSRPSIVGQRVRAQRAAR
jgi:hypothetical protein